MWKIWAFTVKSQISNVSALWGIPSVVIRRLWSLQLYYSDPNIFQKQLKGGLSFGSQIRRVSDHHDEECHRSRSIWQRGFTSKLAGCWGTESKSRAVTSETCPLWSPSSRQALPPKDSIASQTMPTPREWISVKNVDPWGTFWIQTLTEFKCPIMRLRCPSVWTICLRLGCHDHSNS